MSEAEFLNFDKDEFVVIEGGIEFEEPVQREERVRFYTKKEQEQDAFERIMPKGRSTLAQRTAARNEVLRYSDLYDEFVVVTENDYKLKEAEKTTSIPWVVPIYSMEPPKYKYPDPDDEGGTRLQLDINRSVGYYPRMIRSLPIPYTSTDELVYPIEAPTEFVDNEGKIRIRALPDFQMVTTLVNSDKTIDIRKKVISNTGDKVSYLGYYLFPRGVPVPNQLPGHPFFEDAEPKAVLETAAFSDMFPDMEAIFEHGIPPTQDPYGEGSKFLKVYDVKLSSIPWSLWKSRFPPVPLENEPREPIDLAFPKNETPSISDKIQEIYGFEHSPGMSPREWLMRQVDGGYLIVKLLLSMSSESGNVEMIPGLELPIPAYQKATVEECRLSGLSFQDYSVRGLLRRTWKIEKKDGKDVDVINLSCVPIEYIRQEQSRIGYSGRKAWKDSTEDEIKERYIRLLKKYVPIKDAEEKKEIGNRTPVKEESKKRVEALAILKDEGRDRADKHRDIKSILEEGTIFSENTYTDTAGLFVLCAHTLAILAGDLLENTKKFYDTWGVKDSGFYVCKVCGQHIDTVEFNTEDDFDDNGMVIRHAESLDVPRTDVVMPSTALELIRPLIDKNSVAHSVLFLIIGILQVEPVPAKMTMYLNAASVASEGLPTNDAGKFVRGIIGLITAGVLLQTHDPILVPRRSFGPRPLKLAGFPRDTDNTDGQTVFDSLMSAVRKTFEAYPSAISDMYSVFVREVVKDSGKVRVVLLRTFADKFVKKQPEFMKILEEAKLRAPVATEVPEVLPEVVRVPEKLGVIRNYPDCMGSRAILGGVKLPKIRQEEAALKAGIQAASSLVDVVKSASQRTETRQIEKREIQRLVRMKDAIKGTFFEKTLGDSVQTNLAIASRLADMFQIPKPIREIDPTQDPDELRDYARGLVYELVDMIKRSPALEREFDKRVKSDPTLVTLSSNLSAQKEEVRRISATERMSVVKANSKMTDIERDVNTQLTRIGMGPILITLKHRDKFAGYTDEEEEEAEQIENEVGVGLVQNYGLDDGEGRANAAAGNYGDLPGRFEGRDVEIPGFADDRERGI